MQQTLEPSECITIAEAATGQSRPVHLAVVAEHFAPKMRDDLVAHERLKIQIVHNCVRAQHGIPAQRERSQHRRFPDADGARQTDH